MFSDRLSVFGVFGASRTTSRVVSNALRGTGAVLLYAGRLSRAGPFLVGDRLAWRRALGSALQVLFYVVRPAH